MKSAKSLVKKRQRIKNKIKKIRHGQSDGKSIEHSMSSLEESDASGKESMNQIDRDMLCSDDFNKNQREANNAIEKLTHNHQSQSLVELTNNCKDFDMICEMTLAHDKDLTESENKEATNSESNIFVNEVSHLESCGRGISLTDQMD